MSRLLAGAVVVFVGAVLFHHAAYDTLGNFKSAWNLLQGAPSGAGGKF